MRKYFEIEKIRPNKKEIIFYSIFTFFYIFPLLLVNNYYQDDLARSIDGYGWHHDGRFLSNLLYKIFSFNPLIADPFPYSIILASFILTIAGFFISKILDIEQNQKIKFSGLLLLVNPLMLENLSFRWDSLPMSISVICVIIPFLYLNNYKKFIPFSILGIFVCLFTYQASVVIYALLVLSLIISYCLNQTTKSIVYILKVSFISIIVAFIFYKITILYIHLDYNKRDATIFTNPSLVSMSFLEHKGEAIWDILRRVLNYPMRLVALIILILFLYSSTKFLFSKNKIISKIVLFVSILVIGFTILFIPIVSIKDITYPRVILGSSFFIYTPLIFINNISEKFTKYICISVLVLALPLMAAYSNSLKNQYLFELYLAKKISKSIETEDKKIGFDDVAPWAPELEVAINNYPILTSLVPKYVKQGFFSSTLFFRKNTYTKKLFFKDDEYLNLPEIKRSMPIIDRSNEYYIRANDSIVIIDFLKEEN